MIFEMRPLTVGDVTQVAELAKRVGPRPWSAESFLAELEYGLCWVVAEGGEIRGFIAVRLLHDEWHLMNLGIDPVWRRRGLAREMLNKVIGELQAKGGSPLLLEVRSGNEAAVALYKTSGFEVVGGRKGYYPSEFGAEDALLMAFSL